MLFKYQKFREELQLTAYRFRRRSSYIRLNPIKVLIGHGLKRVFGWLFRFVAPKFLQAILKPLAFFPLRGLINLIWIPVLRLTGYRNLMCEWTEHLRKKTNSPGHHIMHIDALLHAARFDDATAAIKLVSKRIHGSPRFNKFRAQVNSRRVILDIEENGIMDWHANSLVGDSIVATYFYHRMWTAHNMRMTSKTVDAASAYLAASAYPQEFLPHIWTSVLEPNGLTGEMLFFVQKAREYIKAADKTPKISPKITLSAALKIFKLRDVMVMLPDVLGRLDIGKDETKLDRLEFNLLFEQGDFTKLPELAKKYADESSFAVIISRYYTAIDQQKKSSETLENALIEFPANPSTKDPKFVAQNMERAAILGELGEHYEDYENYNAALLYFRRAINTGATGTYLASVSYPWRYMVLLMSTQKWDEAVYTMRDGQEYMWSTLHAISTTSQAKRMASDYAISDKGALFLGGWGIGDEILRLSILRNTKSKDGKYGFLCDPRMKEVAQRSLPEIEFMSNSRTVGPFKVDEEQYWQDREGVTAGLDFARTTTQVLERRKDFPDIAITEDLVYHYMKCRGTYKVRDDKPLFVAKPELVKNARDWLNTLPKKLNVAIAWRSGGRSFIRDKSYSEIIDWGKILKLPNINFINVQYSDTSAEVKQVLDRHEVNIHAMPNVDLKDDIEEILALSTAVDLVISPCTASLEMAGAVGAATWSLATTSPKSDYWRINTTDRETDVFFPSIKHITLDPYGSTQEVLNEVARRLNKWQKLEMKQRKTK